MLVCKQINPDLDWDLFQQNVDKIWYTMWFLKFFGRIIVIVVDIKNNRNLVRCLFVFYFKHQNEYILQPPAL